VEDVKKELVECKLISVPKGGKDVRTFNKEFAQTLAQSIKTEGMHNAIVLRPDPEKPGHYLVIQGRHRLYSVSRVLKEQFIEAKIVDIDEKQAEFASLSENLWRNPLTKGQHSIALKRWWEYYSKLNPNAKDRTAAARQAKMKSKIEEVLCHNGATKRTQGPDQSKKAIKRQPSDFTKQVAAATGMSERTAERELRVAKAFTEEQLEALDQMLVGAIDRETIARIKDDSERGEIINLIVYGMDVHGALKQVLGGRAPGRSNQSCEAAAAAAQAKGESDTELSDDQWLETYCGDKIKLLKDPAKYKVDALLFRWVLEARTTFRGKVKTKAKLVKANKVYGLFFGVLNRLIAVSHPKDWPLCGSCVGKGHDDAGQSCKTCYGGGYQLKTEDY